MRLGSSVGISKVTNAEQLHPAISFALQFDTEVLVEKGVVPARELFCGVYQGETGDIQVSACGELSQSSGEFFDYKAKYITVGGCNMYIPADIPPQTAARMQHDTKAVFVALQGSGLARVDFLMDDKGNYYFSEINTLPGLSETSLWPQLFEACGKKYIDLLDGLICTARQVYARKKSLTVSRL